MGRERCKCVRGPILFLLPIGNEQLSACLKSISSGGKAKRSYSPTTMTPPDPNASVVEVRTYFVRGRNAMIARADFEPLFIDYYLHRADQGLEYSNELDHMLKDALAAMTLHLASRPQDESCGWTMNFHEPLLNLFVTGKSRPGAVTGRVFTEDVRDFGKNVLVAQITRPSLAPLQSMVEISGPNVFASVEEYYQQSEQRTARIFRLSDEVEDIVLLTAQPDCDEEWLKGLSVEDAKILDQKEQLSLLETRPYIFHCGCSVERLYPILAKLSEVDLDDVFAGDATVTLTCPRCGARYHTPKTQFLAWRVQQG